MDIDEVIITVVIVGVLLLAGVQAFQADLDNNPVPKSATSEAPLLTTGEFVQVADRRGEGTSPVVVNSRGNAVRLTGANDSYVESKSSFTMASDDNWTVSTWARVNDSAGSKTMTALSANGRVLLQYNGTASEWLAWFYDDGSTNSWRLNASAPNQPGNLTQVAAWHNGTHFALYRNGSRQAVVNTSSGSNIAEAELNATNWHGDLEETRTFDDALNASQFSALNNKPVYPLGNATRTARLMYDLETASSVRIYFAPTSATLSNVTYVDGFSGETMTRGSDYEWLDAGPKIKALSSGRLSAAPVAFVDFDFSEEFSRITMVHNFEVVLNLTPLIFLTLIVVTIGTYLLLVRGR